MPPQATHICLHINVAPCYLTLTEAFDPVLPPSDLLHELFDQLGEPGDTAKGEVLPCHSTLPCLFLSAGPREYLVALEQDDSIFKKVRCLVEGSGPKLVPCVRYAEQSSVLWHCFVVPLPGLIACQKLNPADSAQHTGGAGIHPP